MELPRQVNSIGVVLIPDFNTCRTSTYQILRTKNCSLSSLSIPNRATRMADDFVRALNLIDIDFLPGRFFGGNDVAVINAWHELLGFYNDGPAADANEAVTVAWNLRVEDKLVELLAAMAKALGHSLTREQLRRGVYHPLGVFQREQAVLAILDGLKKSFSGQGIPMAIKEIPVNPDLVQVQAELAHKAAGAYDVKDGALRVKQVK